MFIDTHAHIFKSYYDNIDGIIEKCKKCNVCKIIVSGCDMESNIEVLELIKKYDIVYGTIGFHPTELEGFEDKFFSFLEEHVNDNKVVGIGEIGLDYHYEKTDKIKQKEVFRKQLEIAEKYNKPIVIHSRDSIQDTYNILKDYNLKGSIHCFSGSKEMAREFIKIGFKIGVGGIITYKNAKNIKEVVKDIDMSYILLETDSPYLSPEPYRGTKNDPSNVVVIASAIADIKNLLVQDVMRVTTSNSEGVFDFSLK